MKKRLPILLIFFMITVVIAKAQDVSIGYSKNSPALNTGPEIKLKRAKQISVQITGLPANPSITINGVAVTLEKDTNIVVLIPQPDQFFIASNDSKGTGTKSDPIKIDNSLSIILGTKRWDYKVTFTDQKTTDPKTSSKKLSPIIDAIDIANAFHSGNHETGALLLEKYNLDASNIEKNPYLGHFKPEIITAQATSSDLGNSAMGLLASSSQSLAPQAAILDGIAQFLVKRFTAEINVWFLDGFKAKLDEIPGFKVLLPNTYQVLTRSDPYNYPIFIQSFREAFQSDLKDIHKNFIVLLNDEPEMKKLLTELNIGISYDELKPAIEYINLASFIDQSLRYGEDLPDVIEGLPGQYDMDDDLAGALNLAALLSKGLRDTSGDWVSASKIPLLYNKEIDEFNRQPFWIFWGLIHQIDLKDKQMDKVTFSGGTITLRDLLDNMTDAKFNALFTAFQKTARKGIATFNQGKALQQQDEQNGTLNIESFDPFVLSTLDFVGEGINLAMVIAPDNAGLCKVKHQILPATKEIWGAVTEADKKNYALGLNHIVSAFKIITDKSLGACPVTGTEAAQAKESGWGKELIKYGSFMVTLINAKTADDVEAALESAALPVGSYTIKRQNHLTMGMNAWVGPSVGMEHLTDKTIANSARNKTSISLMAPIGPYISLGPNASSFVPKCDKVIWKPSFFLMVSVLDLGALVNFRLQDSSALDLPEITFKNFLAPGVHLGINPFPRAPLSLGGYWQYGPIARSVSTSSVGTSAGWKAGIWLGVDISIFNFYTRPDSKAKSKWYRTGG